MKKFLLFACLFFVGLNAFSQAVTSLTYNITGYSQSWEKQYYLWVDTGITFKMNVAPADAANKTVHFTIDSGDACYFTSPAPYSNPAKMNCTAEGKIKITAAAQDGSGISVVRTFTVKKIETVNSYRLYFNDPEYISLLSEEHYMDSVPVYKFSQDGNALRIDCDKAGELLPDGKCAWPWKAKNPAYGFSPFVIRLNPYKGIRLDMHEFKNIRIKMKGSNTKGFAGPDYRFLIASNTNAWKPNSVNVDGKEVFFKADTVNYVREIFNTNGFTGTTEKYDSNKVDFFWMKINNGAIWAGWALAYSPDQYRKNDFKGTIWIESIAFGAAADSIPVEKITVVGNTDVVYQGSNPTKKFSYTFSWTPNDATVEPSDFFWSTSDLSIATIDGAGKLTPKKAGTVKVICTVQDGSNVKGELEIEVSGNFDLANGLLNDYAVYPNPAKDQLTIAGSETLSKAEIIDAAGVIMKAVAGQNTYELQIAVNDLPAGMYLVKCYALNGEMIVKKIIKE